MLYPPRELPPSSVEGARDLLLRLFKYIPSCRLTQKETLENPPGSQQIHQNQQIAKEAKHQVANNLKTLLGKEILDPGLLYNLSKTGYDMYFTVDCLPESRMLLKVICIHTHTHTQALGRSLNGSLTEQVRIKWPHSHNWTPSSFFTRTPYSKQAVGQLHLNLASGL